MHNVNINQTKKLSQQKAKKQFLKEVLEYANIIYTSGTQLQVSWALDLLFDVADEVENRNDDGNVILFPNK